jgi:AcrR family transcriptional regulator
VTTKTPGPQAPARVRNRRRVLRAARTVVADGGLEALTMRQLALEADVSVATLYNLIGGRDAVVGALCADVIEDLDRVLTQVDGPTDDPLDWARSLLTAVIETVTTEVPRRLVFALLSDPRLYREFAPRFRSQLVFIDAMDAMVHAGMLTDELSVDVIARQIWSSQANYLRQWAAEALDERELRAAVLHEFDLCLLAVATSTTRAHLLDDARSLERDLQHL